MIASAIASGTSHRVDMPGIYFNSFQVQLLKWFDLGCLLVDCRDSAHSSSTKLTIEMFWFHLVARILDMMTLASHNHLPDSKDQSSHPL